MNENNISIIEFNYIFNRVRKIYGETSLIYTDTDNNIFLYYLLSGINVNNDGSVINDKNVTFIGREYIKINHFLDKVIRIKKLLRINENEMK